MVPYWFAYPPYNQEDFLARVLGRKLEPISATLKDYAYVEDRAYPHVQAQEGSQVEGSLYPTALGDDWMLDDEFGVGKGYYRRVELAVETAEGSKQAWVLTGGPSLAWVLSQDEVEGQE